MNKRTQASRKESPPSSDQGQEALFAASQTPSPWPDSARLPHNEGEEQVGRIVAADLTEAADALIVTPTTDLGSLVGLLSTWPMEGLRPLRLLLGSSTVPSASATYRVRQGDARTQIHESWMERGLNVQAMLSARKTIDLLVAARIEVKVYNAYRFAASAIDRASERQPRALDARIVLTDHHVIIGSSDLTTGGLSANVHGNLRISVTEKAQYEPVRVFAEELWKHGEDWTKGLKELLDALVHICTWQEALARACALVLDGDWAKRRVLKADERPLWPHQEVALSRGLYLLDQCGGLIVADATGSGKTRLGAALFGAALERRRGRVGNDETRALAVVPPGVRSSWEKELKRRVGAQTVYSHGLLSTAKESDDDSPLADVYRSRLLALDEAHNFLNQSKRTRALHCHLADEVMLFTATPINRGATDILAMLEIIGADNLDDEHIAAVMRLIPSRRVRDSPLMTDEQAEELRSVLKQFVIRRTRAHLRQYIRDNPERYVDPQGRSLVYPEHKSISYDLPLDEADREIVQSIREEAKELKGIGWFGEELILHDAWREIGLSETQALLRTIGSACALARYHVLHALRSSRAALIEHTEGTAAARLYAELPLAVGRNSEKKGGQIAKLASHEMPRWRLNQSVRSEAPTWLVDQAAHRDACKAEIERYQRITMLARSLSGARETKKVEMLLEVHLQHARLLAFDHSLITLELFKRSLRGEQAVADIFSGRGGAATKRRVGREFAPDASERRIGLCTDAFSEGFNLQGASCVVHLDMPTVIRMAVQRAGRVDRIDSPHKEIQIAWPREPREFLPSRAGVLEVRRREEHLCIGTDLKMPEDEEELMDCDRIQADYHKELEHHGGLEDAFDLVEGLMTGESPRVLPADYERMRASQGKVRCAVALLPTDEAEWAFFVIAGREPDPPRWVLYKAGIKDAITDLAEIAKFFQVYPRPGDVSSRWPLDFGGLEREARRLSDLSLLSRRRQKSLRLMDAVLSSCSERAGKGAPSEDYGTFNTLQRAVTGQDNIDLRALADRWIEYLRPRWKIHLKSRRRSRLPQLSDLQDELVGAPPLMTELTACFEGVPSTRPIQDRVLVAIVASNPSIRR